tara:strand:- start:32 stop:340 length:309 start_codon:yes stop_codon:yes gene_type:complete
MAVYKNFTGNTPGTDPSLISKGALSSAGSISKISIACTHDSVDLIVDRLYIDNGTEEFDIIANVKVPVGTTLILKDVLSFDASIFDLKIKTTNSSNCSIIIK